ncbi:MAG TPA: hypothetical protein ENH94_02020, partial [Phycisphaerales bacterium]|nr:hypothetical protein [Phycisphaerales bacterium]
MITDAYTDRKRSEVMTDTWGHLAPKKEICYKTRIVYAIGCYESGELNPTPICVEIDGLPDSPWLYEDIMDYLQTLGEKPQGTIWRFNGVYENRQFTGVHKVFLNMNNLNGESSDSLP